MPEEPELSPEEHTELEADDAYLDALGAGLDVPGEPLNQLRARVAGQIDWSRFPSAHTARGQMPPGTTTGGRMSIAEDAARLRSIELPFGAIQQAQQMLDGVLEQTMMILGDGAAGAQAVQGAIQAAKLEIDGGYNLVQEVENQLHLAADRHLGS